MQDASYRSKLNIGNVVLESSISLPRQRLPSTNGAVSVMPDGNGYRLSESDLLFSSCLFGAT